MLPRLSLLFVTPFLILIVSIFKEASSQNCPDHLIPKVCADTCPPSCSSLHGKVPCSNGGGCIRGCFCPEGFVKESEMSDRCVKPSQCPGVGIPCGSYEEYRTCGHKCPITCDTLNTNVCCDVTCSSGCFCQDGYILVSNVGPRKCVPFNDCPKPGYLEFRDLTLTVLESVKVVEIVVLRLNGSYGEISVGWRTVSGTAEEQTDFIPSRGILVFPDGVTSLVIRIEIVDDSIREPDEFFSVVLFDPTNNAEISPRVADGLKIIIKDDDMRPGHIQIETINISVPENIRTVTITLIRLQGHDGSISIQYRTVDGTARSQTDFVPVTGMVTFNDGERRKTIEVTIIDDTIYEPTESFQLQFFNPTAASDVINFRHQSSSLTAVITIVDNDMRRGYIQIETTNISVPENIRTVTVTLVRLQGQDGIISIQYRTVDGTARGQNDYVPVTGMVTFNDGERRKTVEVTIIDDTIYEPTEIFQLQFFNPTAASDVINFRQQSSSLTAVIAIVDNDMRPGHIEVSTVNITVLENVGTILASLNRVGGTDGIITIQYRTVDGTALAQTDYVPVNGAITFNEGETRKTVAITIIDDTVWEPTEIFQLQFFNPTVPSDVINFRQQSSSLYVNIYILDNDMKPGYIQMDLVTITVSERVGTVNVNLIRLGGTNGRILIQYRTVDETALARSDYVPVTGEVVFNDGEDKKLIPVSIIDDDIREPTENFQIILFDPSAAPDVVNFRSQTDRLAAKIFILDDDMKPGYLELEQTDYTIREDYGTLHVTIVRVGGTDGILQLKYRTVDVVATATLDYVPALGDLVFQDGELQKTIDIIIVNDNIREPLETFQLQIYDLTAGPDTINFRALGTRMTASIKIIDEDARPGYLECEQANMTVKEDSGTLPVNVIRIGGTDGVLTVKYKTIDVSAAAQSDYVPIMGDLVFKDGENKKTINILIVNDDIRESVETFQLQIFDITAGPGIINFRSLGTKMITNITIIDDDDNAGVFEFQSIRMSVPESIGVLTLSIVRKDGSNGLVSLQLRTISATATEGVDYILSFLTVIFPDGVTEKTITIQIVDDNIKETDENFLVGIFNPTNGGILGNNKIVTVVIVDDDEPSIIRFPRRSGSFGTDVGFVDIPVLRENRLDRRVSVYWRTEDLSARANVNYRGTSGALLTFEPRESRKTLRIGLLTGRQYESSDLFDVVLFDPSEGAVLGEPSRYTVQQLEFRRNDPPAVTSRPPPVLPFSIRLSFNVRNIRVRENVGVILITISRSGDLLPFSIKVKTLDGSAVAGRDYRKVDGSLSFGKGDTSIVIALRIIDDQLYEPDETFTLKLLEPSLGAVLFGIDALTVTILDDDDEAEAIPRRSTSDAAQQHSAGFGLLTKCPDHLILKECAETCPPSCSSLHGKVPCSNGGGCIRGCFCPEGFVKESEMSDRCVKPSQCPGGLSRPSRIGQRSRPLGLLS